MNEWMNRWEEFRKSAANFHQFLTVEDLIHATHISLKNQYLYVETPKVACSTVKRMLIDAEYGREVKYTTSEHLPFREFSPLLNPRQVGDFKTFVQRKDIFKFCFVRNLFTRLLSCYLEKILNRKPQSHQIYIQLGYGLFSDKTISFPEFIHAVIRQPLQQMDPHWRIQYYGTFQPGIRFNFIGRFETFERDLQYFTKQIGLDFASCYWVENQHATGANHQIQHYYTSELIEKVIRKYQDDFEFFGYPKDLPVYL